MKKRIVSYIVSLFLVLFLTGCVKIERGIEIKANNMIKVSCKVAVQEDLISLAYDSKGAFYDEFADSFRKDNFRVTKDEYYEGNTKWCEIEGEQELPNVIGLINYLSVDDSEDSKVEIDGFLLKTVTVTLKNNNPPKDKNDVNKIISDEFYIKVPSKIISTNGIIDKNDPTKATWDVTNIDTGAQSEKIMTVTYRNNTVFLYLVIALIILTVLLTVFGIVLAAILIKISNSKDKKKKEENEALEKRLIEEVELHYNSGTISYTQRCERIDEIKRKKYYK